MAPPNPDPVTGLSPSVRVGTLTVPPSLVAKIPYFRTRGPTLGGISGGRTSALMHVLTLAAGGEGAYLPCFANTGKEHEGTLVFLRRLAEATGTPIRWMEFVPPAAGNAPREATARTVTFDTAARNGEPFEAFLETLAGFRREVKGLGPVVPHATRRLCTSYMKIKIQKRLAAELWPEEDVENRVGLRADEPQRAARLATHDRGFVTASAPLSRAGIVKADVLAFWRAQPFDLEIPEYQGNCTKCFLKDEADLARSMHEDPSDVGWWVALQETYGNFRPNDRVQYPQIAAEAGVRLDVVAPAVARGEEPVCPENFDPRRFRLIVRQEQRRARLGAPSFSCACESAAAGDDELEASLG